MCCDEHQKFRTLINHRGKQFVLLRGLQPSLGLRLPLTCRRRAIVLFQKTKIPPLFMPRQLCFSGQPPTQFFLCFRYTGCTSLNAHANCCPRRFAQELMRRRVQGTNMCDTSPTKRRKTRGTFGKGSKMSECSYFASSSYVTMRTCSHCFSMARKATPGRDLHFNHLVPTSIKYPEHATSQQGV